MPYDLTGAVPPIGTTGPAWPTRPPATAPPVEGEGAHAPGTKDARGQGEGDGQKDAGRAESGEAGSGATTKRGKDGEPLSSEEQSRVRELKARDREVRAHEQAHVSAGGQHVRGGAHYSYEVGPDGKRYAVGGEVSIDTSEEGTPEATIRKAQVVRRAALAPAEPSGSDRAIAAQASRMEAEARGELARERRVEAEEARQAQAEQARGEEGQAGGTAEGEELVQSPGPPSPYEAAAGPPEVGRVIDVVA